MVFALAPRARLGSEYGLCFGASSHGKVKAWIGTCYVYYDASLITVGLQNDVDESWPWFCKAKTHTNLPNLAMGTVFAGNSYHTNRFGRNPRENWHK